MYNANVVLRVQLFIERNTAITVHSTPKALQVGMDLKLEMVVDENLYLDFEQ